MFRVLCFCVCVFVSSCVCDFLSVSGDGDSPRLSQRPARPTRDNITLYTNTVASGMGYGALARVYWEVRGYSGACRGAKASAKILSFAAKIAKSKVPTQEKKKSAKQSFLVECGEIGARPRGQAITFDPLT